ncbi:hypothetical protein BDR03DRAFT_936867 [Suillus americanus]|nr:hypothetical protein BDR03DRAFT_936867 [Suillus americanus]
MDSFVVLHALINAVTCQAWKHETLEGYQGGINCFTAFCSSINLPASLPVPEWVLCAFAAHHVGTCSGSAIANNIFGLHAWHISNRAPWLGSTCLKYVLRSAKRLTPDSSRHHPRPPVTSEMLDFLHASLNVSTPLYVCVLACGHLGEFLLTSQSCFSPNFFPTPSSLCGLSSSGESLMCRLPWTKVLGVSDPISSLLAHFAFLLVCNSIWAPHGLPCISGYCFHIGGTTELLLHNVPPHIIKVMGRWSSNSFLHYCLLTVHPSDLSSGTGS